MSEAHHTIKRDKLNFLRFRSPASGATAADLVLCDILAEKLRAKGQWIGEYAQ
jgi:hypothetical protein